VSFVVYISGSWKCQHLQQAVNPSLVQVFLQKLIVTRKKTRCSNSLLTKCTSNPDGDFFFESWNLCVNRPETNTSFVHRCQVDGPLDPQDIHNAMRREAILAKLPGGVVGLWQVEMFVSMLNY